MMSHRATAFPTSGPQTLLLDADDTLWENNIHFERAIDQFIAFLDHQHLSPAEVRAVLDEIEGEIRPVHGYGARAFARSLRETISRLTDIPSDSRRLDEAEALGLAILEHDIEVLGGVPETLERLGLDHRLIVITKGDLEEQRLKVERSGIDHLFDSVVITEEKRTATYLDVIATFDLDPVTTWMIGNSPRSDINPALAAGIGAVHIFHPDTWRLEIEDLAIPEASAHRFIAVEKFSDLPRLFPGSP